MTGLSEDNIRTIMTDVLQESHLHAFKEGYARAYHDMGLHDEQALCDIRELRALLRAWRHTKKAIGLTILKTTTTAILILIAAAVWFYGIDKIINKN